MTRIRAVAWGANGIAVEVYEFSASAIHVWAKIADLICQSEAEHAEDPSIPIVGSIQIKRVIPTPEKPTIHDLETILDDLNLAVKINPDGSVGTQPKGTTDG